MFSSSLLTSRSTFLHCVACCATDKTEIGSLSIFPGEGTASSPRLRYRGERTMSEMAFATPLTCRERLILPTETRERRSISSEAQRMEAINVPWPNDQLPRGCIGVSDADKCLQHCGRRLRARAGAERDPYRLAGREPWLVHVFAAVAARKQFDTMKEFGHGHSHYLFVCSVLLAKHAPSYGV